MVPLFEVAIAQTRGLDLDLEAELEDVRLAELRSGERSVFARIQPAEGDDHQLLDLFTTAKGGSVAPLEALMRRDDAPLAELCRLLELPPEALRVISGECGVEDLPGAVVHEPEDDEDALAQRRDWRDVILHLVSVIVFGAGIVQWVAGGSTFWGLLGVAGLILTITGVVKDVSAMRRADDPD